MLEGEGGAVVAAGRIQASMPEEIFLDALLGHDEVGVLVLQETNAAAGELMSHRRWPLTSVRLEGGEVLATIAAFHRDDPLADAVARLKRGVPKAPYTSKTRILRGEGGRPSKRLRLSGEDVAREVSMEECCPWSCCQIFPWSKTVQVRSHFWGKSFDERREVGVELFGRFRVVDGATSGVITMEGVDVCETACWKILGIGRATFYDYKRRYRRGIRSGRHGNTGQVKRRPATVQAEGTVLSIVNDTCDVMPATRMKGIGDGQQDVQKYLPVAFTWEVVRKKVNNVRSRSSLFF